MDPIWAHAGWFQFVWCIYGQFGVAMGNVSHPFTQHRPTQFSPWSLTKWQGDIKGQGQEGHGVVKSFLKRKAAAGGWPGVPCQGELLVCVSHGDELMAFWNSSWTKQKFGGPSAVFSIHIPFLSLVRHLAHLGGGTWWQLPGRASTVGLVQIWAGWVVNLQQITERELQIMMQNLDKDCANSQVAAFLVALRSTFSFVRVTNHVLKTLRKRCWQSNQYTTPASSKLLGCTSSCSVNISKASAAAEPGGGGLSLADYRQRLLLVLPKSIYFPQYYFDIFFRFRIFIRFIVALKSLFEVFKTWLCLGKHGSSRAFESHRPGGPGQTAALRYFHTFSFPMSFSMIWLF